MEDLCQPIRFDRETCPLCGFDMCNFARCPACGHEFPEQLPGESWLQKLFHNGGAAAMPPLLEAGPCSPWTETWRETSWRGGPERPL